MKRQAKTVFIFSCFAIMIASAQSSKEDRSLVQGTQARGYWVDPSTKLMWPAKESDKAITWHKARSYCRNLDFAGYKDWRLPTLDELTTLFDKDAAAPKPGSNKSSFTLSLGRHVRGGLSLAGDPWSSNRGKDRFGHEYGDGSFFDFIHGEPSGDLPYFRNTKYALCVRRSAD